jgi:hypothetical protein
MNTSIASDVTLDYTNKIVGWSGGYGFRSGNALYTYIMDTFDDAGQMDDTIPIEANTPTSYTIKNGWYFTQDLMKHIVGAAFESDGYEDDIRVVSFGATYTNAVAGDIGKTVTGGTTGDTGVLLDYDNTSKKWWVRMTDSGDLFDEAETVEVTTDGGTGTGTSSGASATGEEMFANIYTLGTVAHGNVHIEQSGSKLTSWYDGSAAGVRKLTLASGGYTNAEATDIGKAVVGGTTTDSGILLGYNNTTRQWFVAIDAVGDEFDDDDEAITITSGTGAGTMSAVSSYAEGNASGEATTGDFNDGTATYTHIDVCIKVKEAGTLIDSGEVYVFNRNYGDSYDWANANCSNGGRTPLPLATNSDSTINGTNGLTEAEAEDYTDGTTATVAVSFDSYTYDTDNNGSTENYSVQVDCDSQRLYYVYQALQYLCEKDRSGTLDSVPASCYISDTPATYTPDKKAPFGEYIGGKFYCAQGVYLTNVPSADDSNWQSRDTSGTTYDRPTTVTVEVTGLVATSPYDRVCVFKTSGGSIVKNMYTSHASNNSQGDTTIEMTTSLAADHPATGYVRMVDTSAGTEHRYPYASWTGAIFTLATAVTGTTTADGGSTTITDSGATFVTDGIKAGDTTRNSTDGSWALVKSVDSETQVTTTALAGGSDNTWTSGDGYSFHTLAVTYTDSDTAYVGYIDDIATSSSISTSIQYVEDRTVQIYARNNAHATLPMKPAEATSSITSTGMSVPISRVTDNITS